MQDVNFIGYVILALTSIGSFITLIFKFTQPIQDLKLVIEKLNVLIDQLQKDNEKNSSEICKIHDRLDKFNARLEELNTKVSIYHSENSE